VAWLVANLALAVTVAAVTATLGAVAYCAARWLSRHLLHALGGVVFPVGYRRLRPAAATAPELPEPQPAVELPEPQPAIENRAPLAIEPPRVFAAGEVIAEPAAAAVVINGTRHPVLS
jgi:hypothetical protein